LNTDEIEDKSCE